MVKTPMGSTKVRCFNQRQLSLVGEAVTIAEELTSNAFKMSFAEWRKRRYDVRTVADLSPEEIIHGPFAQIIRYVGRRMDTSLGSSKYDFYKICLQDHNILAVLKGFPDLRLLPFSLYIVCHELIHVIRFSKFLQAFDVSAEQRLEEEARVHDKTRSILEKAAIKGLDPVLAFYKAWEGPLEQVTEP